jgi:hypothetical protein
MVNGTGEELKNITTHSTFEFVKGVGWGKGLIYGKYYSGIMFQFDFLWKKELFVILIE